MCFDTTSSFLSWGISVAIAAYLYKRNKESDRFYALFILCFSLIQLLEGLIWLDLDSKKFVPLLTTLILIGLCLQPIVQTFGSVKYQTSSDESIANLQITGAWFVLGVFLYQIYKFIGSKNYSIVGEKGHLVWTTSSTPNGIFKTEIAIIYLLGLFLPLVIIPTTKNCILALIGVITFGYSWLKTRSKEFGSYWCFTAIAYSVAALLL